MKTDDPNTPHYNEATGDYIGFNPMENTKDAITGPEEDDPNPARPFMDREADTLESEDCDEQGGQDVK